MIIRLKLLALWDNMAFGACFKNRGGMMCYHRTFSFDSYYLRWDNTYDSRNIRGGIKYSRLKLSGALLETVVT